MKKKMVAKWILGVAAAGLLTLGSIACVGAEGETQEAYNQGEESDSTETSADEEKAQANAEGQEATEAVDVSELTFDVFLEDLVTALEARVNFVADNSESDEKSAALQFAAAEWEIMGKYADADFSADSDGDGEKEKTNEEYLRQAYMEGLSTQHNLEGTESDVAFWTAWEEGYDQRANVLMELVWLYGGEDSENGGENNNYKERVKKFPDEVKDQVQESTGGYYEKKEVNGNETAPEPYQMQALLVALGTGITIDGDPGEKTLVALKQQEEDLGLEVNGVINSDLVEKMAEKIEELYTQEDGSNDVIDTANRELIDFGIDTIQTNAEEGGNSLGEAIVDENNE